MIDGAGGGDHHALAAIFAVDIGADHVRRERTDRVARAQDRASHRLMPEGRFGEPVEHHVVRRVGRRAKLLKDDVLFALKFLAVEFRVLEDVGQHVEGQERVLLEHADEKGRRLDAGRRVDVAAHVFDRFGQLTGAAGLGPLERHVLKHVRDAVLLIRLVAGAGLHPDPERHAVDLVEMLRCDGQSV